MRFFSIPVFGGEAAAQELDRFVADHRIVAVDKGLVQNGGASAWAVCVSYEDAGQRPAPSARREKVDYKEVLPEAEFSVFARLRDLRRRLAEQEGVPAYALFTNEQLATMVQQRVTTPTALGAISGVGAARVEKYGELFLAVLREGVRGLADGGKGAGGAP